MEDEACRLQKDEKPLDFISYLSVGQANEISDPKTMLKSYSIQSRTA